MPARPAAAVDAARRMSISWRGFMVAISNPKTIAFFTAFLPQFIDPALPAGHQLLVMCTVAITMAALTRLRLGGRGRAPAAPCSCNAPSTTGSAACPAWR